MCLLFHRTTTIPPVSCSDLWSSVSHELSCQSSTPSAICNLFSSTTSSVPQQGSPIRTTETWQSLQYSWLHAHTQQLLRHLRQLDRSWYGYIHGTQSNHKRRACATVKLVMSSCMTYKVYEIILFLMTSEEVTTHQDVYMNKMTWLGVTLWLDRGCEETQRHKIKI